MKKSTLIIVTIAIIAAVLVVVTLSRKKDQSTIANSDSQVQDSDLSEKEIAEIIKDIKDIILVPEDEEPLVATVLNAAELRAQQPFYGDVQDGDILLIYQSKQKAILFNPVQKKIINVGPLQFNEQAGDAAIVPPPVVTPEEAPQEDDTEDDSSSDTEG
jgi:hypothetical protein